MKDQEVHKYTKYDFEMISTTLYIFVYRNLNIQMFVKI